MIQPYFNVFYSLLKEEAPEHWRVSLGYQFLPLATSKLMGHNKKLDESAIL